MGPSKSDSSKRSGMATGSASNCGPAGTTRDIRVAGFGVPRRDSAGFLSAATIT